ncbi:MAG: helix-turn-helix transcriptional regulator [Acidimicrobiales bacterium]
MGDSLQTEARALGDPTRHRLFRYIAGAPGPVSVAELTGYVQLNHNAVRQHLSVLKEAGLVVEEVEPRSRPGRPRLLYRLHPEAPGRWETGGPYPWLARLLADAVRSKQSPRQVGRQEGHRRASELASTGSGATGRGATVNGAMGGTGVGDRVTRDRATRDRVDLLEAEMLRRGFRPTRAGKGRRVEFVLGRCPFAEVAEYDPSTVCELHRGLAEGLTEGIGGLELERLVSKKPKRAGCRLVVSRQRPVAASP